jgi:lysophospholipase L1-like esterase
MSFLGIRIGRLAVVSLALLGSVPASAQLAGVFNSGRADLSRLVVVGDSLSAGFQNFSLFDGDGVPGLPPGGQTHGYAALVAQQAAVGVTLPLISYPGIPPTLILSAGQIVRAAGIGSRENPTIQAHNISVPGFTLVNALAYPFPGDPLTNPIDALSDYILGLPGTLPGCGPIPIGAHLYVSQVLCAIALKPTVILVSIGNNDALQSLTFGVPPTNPNFFASQYAALLAGLATTHARLVVSNIPDVASLPYLVPVPAFSELCGFTPAGAGATDFVVANITNPAATTFDICANYAVRSAALIAQVRAAVVQYNRIIKADAQPFGAVVVDVNSLFDGIAQNGYNVGGKHLTVAFLGGLFSLDGIHPTNTGYAILANETITTMNQQLHTQIPLVSVSQVAATDPLIP